MERHDLQAREEIWQIRQSLEELHANQLIQADRIGELERRRNEDSKLKSVWEPLSPRPVPAGGSVQTESIFPSPPDAFKGFDQGHHPLGMANSTPSLDPDEEPRRGASRANSVRFDESAIHGYYGQNSRSATDLPLRTGSGMSSLPLSERSFSHRSDGRLSSSGLSLHSARTNSLRIDTFSRAMDSSFSGSSPITPPPGLFVLGPVPSIIRCWLTTNFSHETVLYAAVCSGSCVSTVSASLIRNLGLENTVFDYGDRKYVKITVHLTEASLRQVSSFPASPGRQVPTITVRFLVREQDASDETVGIILGIDALQYYNADILLTKNKVTMVDDERNHISIPLVRPERASVFKALCTGSSDIGLGISPSPFVNMKRNVGVIGPPTQPKSQASSAPASACGSIQSGEGSKKPQSEDNSAANTETASVPETSNENAATPSKPGATSVWATHRSKLSATAAPYKATPRAMKVLRPMKHSSRAAAPTAPATPTAPAVPPGYPTYPPAPLGPMAQYPVRTSPYPLPSGPYPPPQVPQVPYAPPQSAFPPLPGASNPVGGASAFQWLNPQPGTPFGNNNQGSTS